MPQAGFDYEQLHRARVAARRARLAAERKEIELLRPASGLAALRVQLASSGCLPVGGFCNVGGDPFLDGRMIIGAVRVEALDELLSLLLCLLQLLPIGVHRFVLLVRR